MLATADMPPKRNVQITVRVDPEILVKLDQLAGLLSVPGHDLTRADALRIALARGVDQLISEHGANTNR